jgi:SOS-response transcriptional repressor LexA
MKKTGCYGIRRTSMDKHSPPAQTINSNWAERTKGRTGVLPEYIKEIHPRHLMAHTNSRKIPLANTYLPAGQAVEPSDDGYALLDLNFLITSGREDYLAFVVTGDSMSDEIRPGYIVIIDPIKAPINGDLVVACINGRNCIKMFYLEPPKLFLVSNNPEHVPIEVHQSDSLDILGVVKAHLALH